MEEPTVLDVSRELERHEVQCEERWKTTFNRLERIDQKLETMQERQLYAIGTLVVFLGGVIVTLAIGV